MKVTEVLDVPTAEMSEVDEQLQRYARVGRRDRVFLFCYFY